MNTHPLIDSLEPRRLLSGATLSHGLLSITGTAGNDEIYVVNGPATGQLTVNINMQQQDFAADDVQQIQIDAGDGNDYVAVGGFHINAVHEDVDQGGVQRSLSGGQERHVSGKTKALRDLPRVVSGKTMAKRLEGERIVSGKTKANRLEGIRIVSGKTRAHRQDTVVVAVQRSFDSTPAAAEPGEIPDGTINSIPATIIGGAGDDELHGSDAGDNIDGGAGNDLIMGFGGDDALVGGNGDDTILGGAGNDSIDAGNGDDLIAANSAYYYTQIFSRDASGNIASGQSYQVPISADGFTDSITGGNGADTFHSTDSGEVQDQTAADTVSNQSILMVDIL